MVSHILLFATYLMLRDGSTAFGRRSVLFHLLDTSRGFLLDYPSSALIRSGDSTEIYSTHLAAPDSHFQLSNLVALLFGKDFSVFMSCGLL